MFQQILIRCLGATDGIYLLVTTIGFNAIRDRYPEARYNERITGLIAAYILPSVVVGSFLGLTITEIVANKRKQAQIKPDTAQSLESIAREQLRRRDVTDREIEAWGTILSLKESENNDSK